MHGDDEYVFKQGRSFLTVKIVRDWKCGPTMGGFGTTRKYDGSENSKASREFEDSEELKA